MKNTKIKHKEKNTKKAQNLSIYLTKEIFDFLPIAHLISEIFSVCKSFAKAIRNEKYFQLLKKHFKTLITFSDFCYSKTKSNIEIILPKSDLNEIKSEALYIYLLIRKTKNQPNLTVNYRHIGATAADLLLFFKFLENKKAVKSLSFRGNNLILTQENEYFIKKAFEKNKQLESLDLSDNRLERC
jgi:hypothetical protein